MLLVDGRSGGVPVDGGTPSTSTYSSDEEASLLKKPKVAKQRGAAIYQTK